MLLFREVQELVALVGNASDEARREEGGMGGVSRSEGGGGSRLSDVAVASEAVVRQIRDQAQEAWAAGLSY